MKENKNNFEKNIQELDKIVDYMENGTISLNDSMKYYEKGIKLINQCMKELKRVEKKVKILNKDIIL